MSQTLLCAADLRVALSCIPVHLHVISPIGIGLSNWMDSGLCMAAAIRKRDSAYVKAMVLGTSLFMEARLRERFIWEFGSVPSLAEAGCVGRD